MLGIWLLVTCVDATDRAECRRLGFEDGLSDGYDEGFVEGWIAAGGDPSVFGIDPGDTGGGGGDGGGDPGGGDPGSGDPGSGDPGA